MDMKRIEFKFKGTLVRKEDGTVDVRVEDKDGHGSATYTGPEDAFSRHNQTLSDLLILVEVNQ